MKGRVIKEMKKHKKMVEPLNIKYLLMKRSAHLASSRVNSYDTKRKVADWPDKSPSITNNIRTTEVSLNTDADEWQPTPVYSAS